MKKNLERQTLGLLPVGRKFINDILPNNVYNILV